MGGVVIGSIVIGVVEILDRDRPTYWGTFTEKSTVCGPGPRGSCTQTGTWVSDDGTIVKVGVILDGSVEPGRSVAASYKPGGAMGDDENNVVHTAFWSKGGLWVPWVLALTFGAVIWDRHRRWRGDARGRRYVGRHNASDPSE
jgi:hypothetical protein